jgi:hypothetical protein
MCIVCMEIERAVDVRLLPEQHQRLEKITYEPLYLLVESAISDTNEHVFKVCGSTRSVYTVTLSKNLGMFGCNCMDMMTRCRKSHCVCKHICFILVRVLKLTPEECYRFFVARSNRLLGEDLDAVSAKCEGLSAHLDAFVTNAALTEQYKMMTDLHFNPRKEISDDDECPICYLSLKGHHQVVGCPVCKNNIHHKCISKWIEQSPSATCVYCRSSIWERYNNGASAAKASSGYIKL